MNQISKNKFLWVGAAFLVVIIIGTIVVAGIKNNKKALTSTESKAAAATVSASTEASQNGKTAQLPSMAEVYSKYFKIGTAIEPDILNYAPETALLKTQFNSFTCENTMKFGYIEPKENVFDFTKADPIVQFAIKNNKRLVGHCLVWYREVPDWLFKDSNGNPLDPKKPEDVKLVDQRLKNHITQVVTHYEQMGHAVERWDVVNEAIDESQPDGYRKTDWFKFLGPSYIEKAYQYAYEADMQDGKKDLRLFYNDFQTENDTKREWIIKLVKGLKAKGIPIDGIGIQCHIGLQSPSTEAMSQTIDQFSALGVDLEITEMDVDIYDKVMLPMGHMSHEIDVALGYRYKDVFDLLKEKSSKAKITAVTLWGFYDARTWLNMPDYASNTPGHPLPFDERLNPKLAFWGIVDSSKLPPRINNIQIYKGTPQTNDIIDAQWSSIAPNKIKADSTEMAQFKVQWDDNNIFYYFKVNDPSKDAADKIDIFIDPKASFADKAGPEVKHYTIKRTGEVSGGTITAKSEEIQGGYQMVVDIPMSGLLVDRKTAFDVSVSDASKVTSWNDLSNSQDKSTANYGIGVFFKQLKQAEAAFADTAPVLDGKMDKVWEKAKVISTDTQAYLLKGYNNPATGDFRVLWDDKYIYVFAHVKDSLLNKSSSNAYEQDSAEVFLDEDNSKSNKFDLVGDAQYRVNFDNYVTVNTPNPNYEIKSAAMKTADGYNVEMRITPQQITPKEGLVMGFDIQVNDSDAAAVRKSYRTWAALNNTGWQNSLEYGVIKMVK